MKGYAVFCSGRKPVGNCGDFILLIVEDVNVGRWAVENGGGIAAFLCIAVSTLRKSVPSADIASKLEVRMLAEIPCPDTNGPPVRGTQRVHRKARRFPTTRSYSRALTEM